MRDAGEMLGEELVVLRDVPVVEVGDPHVEEDVEQVREVGDGQIDAISPVTGVADQVLHFAVNAQNPERLHQKVQEEKKDNILDEAILHCSVEDSVGKGRKKTILRGFYYRYKQNSCIFTTKS